MVCTTNSKGEKEFVDRTLPENKILPLYKLLSLKDLGVYWLSNHEKLYGDYGHEEALKNMREFLKEIVMPAKNTVPAVKKDYIISLSATCRVIQKNKKSAWVMEKPDFDVKLDLKPIDLHLKKPQLQDLIKLLEFFNKYERFKNQKHIEKQRALGPHNVDEIEKDIEEFKKSFTKIYKHPQRDELRGNEKLTVMIGDHKEIERFKDLLVVLPEKSILKTVKKVVKEIEREKQLKAYDEKKQEKKGFLGGWISWGGDQEEKDPKKREEKAKEAARLREEEEAKIERYLQGLFGEDVAGNEAAVKEGEHRNLLALNFLLEGANIHLSHTSAAGNEEGVNFFIKGLQVDVGMTTKGKKVGLTVKDMGFGLRTKAAGSSNYIDTAVVRRVNYWLPLEEAKSILAFDFEENPKGKFEGMYVKLDLQRVEVIFRSAVTERMLNFFKLKIKDEALMNQAVDQLEKVQKKAEEAANSVVENSIKKKVTVNIDAPVIVIPFLQNGDPNSECWVLNLGNLGVNTKEPECAEDYYYESFLLNLQRIKFQYFPTQTLYKKVQRSLVEKGDLEGLKGEDKESYEKKVFDLVEEFSIDVELDQILNEYKARAETKEKPQMNVEVMIPDINFKLRPDIYGHLLKTKEVFAALEEAHLEFVEASYKKMLEGSTKAGSLYVFEKYFGNMAWVKYECILSKGYMYFFKSVTDDRPLFSYSLKDMKVRAEEAEDQKNIFLVFGIFEMFYINSHRWKV